MGKGGPQPAHQTRPGDLQIEAITMDLEDPEANRVGHILLPVPQLMSNETISREEIIRDEDDSDVAEQRDVDYEEKMEEFCSASDGPDTNMAENISNNAKKSHMFSTVDMYDEDILYKETNYCDTKRNWTLTEDEYNTGFIRRYDDLLNKTQNNKYLRSIQEEDEGSKENKNTDSKCKNDSEIRAREEISRGATQIQYTSDMKHSCDTWQGLGGDDVCQLSVDRDCGSGCQGVLSDKNDYVRGHTLENADSRFDVKTGIAEISHVSCYSLSPENNELSEDHLTLNEMEHTTMEDLSSLPATESGCWSAGDVDESVDINNSLGEHETLASTQHMYMDQEKANQEEKSECCEIRDTENMQEKNETLWDSRNVDTVTCDNQNIIEDKRSYSGCSRLSMKQYTENYAGVVSECCQRREINPAFSITLSTSESNTDLDVKMSSSSEKVIKNVEIYHAVHAQNMLCSDEVRTDLDQTVGDRSSRQDLTKQSGENNKYIFLKNSKFIEHFCLDTTECFTTYEDKGSPSSPSESKDKCEEVIPTNGDGKIGNTIIDEDQDLLNKENTRQDTYTNVGERPEQMFDYLEYNYLNKLIAEDVMNKRQVEIIKENYIDKMEINYNERNKINPTEQIEQTQIREIEENLYGPDHKIQPIRIDESQDDFENLCNQNQDIKYEVANVVDANCVDYCEKRVIGSVFNSVNVSKISEPWNCVLTKAVFGDNTSSGLGCDLLQSKESFSEHINLINADNAEGVHKYPLNNEMTFGDYENVDIELHKGQQEIYNLRTCNLSPTIMNPLTRHRNEITDDLCMSTTETVPETKCLYLNSANNTRPVSLNNIVQPMDNSAQFLTDLTDTEKEYEKCKPLSQFKKAFVNLQKRNSLVPNIRLHSHDIKLIGSCSKSSDVLIDEGKESNCFSNGKKDIHSFSKNVKFSKPHSRREWLKGKFVECKSQEKPSRIVDATTTCDAKEVGIDGERSLARQNPRLQKLRLHKEKLKSLSSPSETQEKYLSLEQMQCTSSNLEDLTDNTGQRNKAAPNYSSENSILNTSNLFPKKYLNVYQLELLGKESKLSGHKHTIDKLKTSSGPNSATGVTVRKDVSTMQLSPQHMNPRKIRCRANLILKSTHMAHAVKKIAPPESDGYIVNKKTLKTSVNEEIDVRCSALESTLTCSTASSNENTKNWLINESTLKKHVSTKKNANLNSTSNVLTSKNNQRNNVTAQLSSGNGSSTIRFPSIATSSMASTTSTYVTPPAIAASRQVDNNGGILSMFGSRLFKSLTQSRGVSPEITKASSETISSTNTFFSQSGEVKLPSFDSQHKRNIPLLGEDTLTSSSVSQSTNLTDAQGGMFTSVDRPQIEQFSLEKKDIQGTNSVSVPYTKTLSRNRNGISSSVDRGSTRHVSFMHKDLSTSISIRRAKQFPHSISTSIDRPHSINTPFPGDNISTSVDDPHTINLAFLGHQLTTAVVGQQVNNVSYTGESVSTFSGVSHTEREYYPENASTNDRKLHMQQEHTNPTRELTSLRNETFTNSCQIKTKFDRFSNNSDVSDKYGAEETIMKTQREDKTYLPNIFKDSTYDDSESSLKRHEKEQIDTFLNKYPNIGTTTQREIRNRDEHFDQDTYDAIGKESTAMTLKSNILRSLPNINTSIARNIAESSQFLPSLNLEHNNEQNLNRRKNEPDNESVLKQQTEILDSKQTMLVSNSARRNQTTDTKLPTSSNLETENYFDNQWKKSSDEAMLSGATTSEYSILETSQGELKRRSSLPVSMFYTKKDCFSTSNIKSNVVTETHLERKTWSVDDVSLSESPAFEEYVIAVRSSRAMMSLSEYANEEEDDKVLTGKNIISTVEERNKPRPEFISDDYITGSGLRKMHQLNQLIVRADCTYNPTSNVISIIVRPEKLILRNRQMKVMVNIYRSPCGTRNRQKVIRKAKKTLQKKYSHIPLTRNIIEIRASNPPFNTTVTEDADERYRKMFAHRTIR